MRAEEYVEKLLNETFELYESGETMFGNAFPIENFVIKYHGSAE